MRRRELVVATKNQHKIDEIAAILATSWNVLGAKALAPSIGWQETGTSFVENARIKADALAACAQSEICILADDSGLEVDALGGDPGVYSSRYAGIEGDDAGNNRKLLDALSTVACDKRTARFVCVLVYRDEKGIELVVRGECPGRIGLKPRGNHGFGYDPLFIPDGFECSMAELSEQEKNQISHRRRALDAWLKALT